MFWKAIKGDKLGYRFRRQHGIGDYIVDFYCSILKLVIEIDGITHDDIEIYKNDLKRQKYLESIGLKVVRYTSSQILWHLREVYEHLQWVCQEREKELKGEKFDNVEIDLV